MDVDGPVASTSARTIESFAAAAAEPKRKAKMRCGPRVFAESPLAARFYDEYGDFCRRISTTSAAIEVVSSPIGSIERTSLRRGARRFGRLPIYHEPVHPPHP
jgi:hypothetical protein